MPSLKTKSVQLKPATIISLSFLSVIIVGTLLLITPLASKSHSFTDPITALFTATSATCVTGLVVKDTGTYWNTFGQLVILAMIQIGGLGLVTFTSFFNFMLRKKLELHSMQVASESVNTSGFHDVKTLVKSVVKISFLCELAGALLLMPSFCIRYGAKGVYIAFYLAVTAFCNAGFDVMGMVEEPFSSLTSVAGDPGVIIVIPLLIIAGGMGFYVWRDLIDVGIKKKNSRLSLQSQLVIRATLALIVVGTLLTLILEWNNPETLGGKSFLFKLGNSFFQSVTLRTAGFNTIDSASLNPLSKMVSIVLMFIGVAPGSTGGGIKITTLVIIIMTVVSVLQNKSDTVILGRKIDKELVYKALAIMFVMALIVICASVAIGYGMPDYSGLDATFEVTSAMSTTGLSVGISGACGIPSKLLLCMTMFIGRVGPVGFAISLSLRKGKQNKNEVYPEGKLMVG